MKTIQFGRQFMEALHTLDIQRVKATAVYAEMCRTEDASKVDLVIEAMLDKLREIRGSFPEEWASIVLNINRIAAVERRKMTR
jgi:hypothetical protein